MGAVKMRVQIADKCITMIHKTPVHYVLGREKLCVCKKQEHHQSVLTLNCCFKLKSIIHNSSSSSEKVHPLLSSHMKIHKHICLELFWTVGADSLVVKCTTVFAVTQIQFRSFASPAPISLHSILSCHFSATHKA